MPEFNDFVYQGLDHFAYARLNKTNNFPEFTSHVCPAPCEGACSASLASSAVSIRNLEQYIIETAFAEGYVKPNLPAIRSGKKVAVIGSVRPGWPVPTSSIGRPQRHRLRTGRPRRRTFDVRHTQYETGQTAG